MTPVRPRCRISSATAENARYIRSPRQGVDWQLNASRRTNRAENSHALLQKQNGPCTASDSEAFYNGPCKSSEACEINLSGLTGKLVHGTMTTFEEARRGRPNDDAYGLGMLQEPDARPSLVNMSASVGVSPDYRGGAAA